MHVSQGGKSPEMSALAGAGRDVRRAMRGRGRKRRGIACFIVGLFVIYMCYVMFDFESLVRLVVFEIDQE